MFQGVENSFECANGSASLIQESNLSCLNSTHAGEIQCWCDHCSASFSQECHLSAHTRAQTGETTAPFNPFEYDNGSVPFSTNSSLASHQRILIVEKPFKCDTCSAAFAQKSNLTCHKRIHTGEKPFKCDKCSAAFSQKSHLKSYKRTHQETNHSSVTNVMLDFWSEFP